MRNPKFDELGKLIDNWLKANPVKSHEEFVDYTSLFLGFAAELTICENVGYTVEEFKAAAEMAFNTVSKVYKDQVTLQPPKLDVVN